MASTRRHKRKDKYVTARGGHSSYLTIFCAACDTKILLYQKDGPGSLYRMYLDRILAPAELAELQHTCASKDDVPTLICPQCGAVIASPMVYAPERRLAFRVIRGRHYKKRGNGAF